MRMKILGVLVAALAATVQALAMPTRAELSKAQLLVNELMAPALEEYKSSADKTAGAVTVGDRASTFAFEAETEAAKFLLLKGAVNYYVRGEAYDKAADCIATMQSGISNLSPDAVVEIVGRATSRMSESKAPRLMAYYRAAKLQIRARKELPVLEKKLRRVKSEQLQRQYAEALAISGNWKAAYDAFAKSQDKNLTQVAADEAKGTAANEQVAELWWNYKPEFEGAGNFFKAHAVEFYQKALDKGEISGLKKNIVERRIAQITEAAVALAVAKTSGAACGADKTAAGMRTIVARIKTHTIKLNDKVNIEFVECPAGTFTMGYEKDEHSPNREHKVTITRPFWMARTKLTLEQYKAYDRGFKPREDFLIDGDKSPLCASHLSKWGRRCALRRKAEAYCEYLTKKFRHAIPNGYVFRLPTDAEWEYAYTAGETNPDDFYGMSGDATKRLPMEEIEKYVITGKYIREYAAKVGQKYGKGYDATGVVVGKCKPNRWGLYDMAGNTCEMVLDTLDAKLLDTKVWYAGFGPNQTALVYKDEEVDPLRYIPTNPADDGKGSGLLKTVEMASRGGDGGKWKRTGFQNSFRIAVGPDLVAEKMAKNGKK